MLKSRCSSEFFNNIMESGRTEIKLLETDRYLNLKVENKISGRNFKKLDSIFKITRDWN